MRTERTRQLATPAVLLAGLLTTAGCVNLAANLLHAVQGNTRPAEYSGLEEQSVAIICGTDSGLGRDATSAMLSRYVQASLNNNVKDIQLVRQEEVESWLDSHSLAESDYVTIGRGVGASRVLAIDVLNMGLKNGATLYQGQADITVTVYDVDKDGKILFRKQIPEFTFPKLGGPTITDTSESKFRGLFLTIVAQKVAGLFYEVEATADFALDATSNSF